MSCKDQLEGLAVSSACRRRIPILKVIDCYRAVDGRLAKPGRGPKSLPGRDCPAYGSVLTFHSPDPATVRRNLTSEHAAVRCDLSSELASLSY
jgi:hypothetical protein